MLSESGKLRVLVYLVRVYDILSWDRNYHTCGHTQNVTCGL